MSQQLLAEVLEVLGGQGCRANGASMRTQLGQNDGNRWPVWGPEDSLGEALFNVSAQRLSQVDQSSPEDEDLSLIHISEPTRPY